MTERSRNVAVGLTAIAGLAGVCVLFLLFGYVPAWLEDGYDLRVRLTTASGLTEGSRVKLSGIDIGRVVGVSLEPPPQKGVIVTTLIHKGWSCPRAYA